jgi:predicted RNA-binding protein Jag
MNMKQVTLNITDNKYKTFMEFIKTLDYVKVEEVEETALQELQNSLNQVKLMKEGKLPKQSAQDFLNEL